ncbi:hypothetical protein [Nocardiopsis tropica]|uniref:Uncharacterized protein n=1 Tax=Nocardiopsis tropica TaxID=109330 RepID=A0ABU7L2H2_9ACTN|nr:hypothetical protein [Nocardiopsis umidischolae]MEE2055751.1 hypothetical protein [Nocardiopsis umidischolae]
MFLTPEQTGLRAARRTRLDAARLLADLEERAFTADLPLLDWQISAAGLIGEPLSAAAPDERRAAFGAWAEHLGADVHEPAERIHPTRVDVLRATARVPHPRASTGTVRVVLTAEIELES